MSGHEHGGSPPTANGTSSTSSPQDLAQIISALEAIYSPQSSNQVRQAASSFLEEAKRHPQAPAQAFALSVDAAQPPALRHYGLSVLEYAIKYGWEDITEEQGGALQEYVVKLAQAVTDQDPGYLRNKVAQLWTELAKRAWAAEWMNMDELLQGLWAGSLAQQIIVLHVLETLSEEIFSKEDPTAGMRHNVLGQACVEIFAPLDILAEQATERGKYTPLNVRHGEEGWLKRLCDILDWCLSDEHRKDARVHKFAVKIANTIRAVLVWIMYRAVASTSCVEVLSKALATGEADIQIPALDALFTLFSRPNYQESDFQLLVCPFFIPPSVELLRKVYEWSSTIDVNDIDEQRYMVCRKLSDTLANLALQLEQKPQFVPAGCDLPGFFELLFAVVKHPSLSVSIPILHVWTKLLRSRAIKDAQIISHFIGGLMDVCCQRLIRYEAFPSDSDDPTYRFLQEDFDTMPERHAFVGNYRRFCEDVVVVTVRRLPLDTSRYILISQAAAAFHEIFDQQSSFQPQNFSKVSQTILRADVYVTVITGVLKGYQKWEISQEANPQQNEQDRSAVQDNFENWARSIMQLKFKDPDIQKKIVQLLAQFSTKALATRPAFALDLLYYTLDITLPDDSSYAPYSDAVKNLYSACYTEMQRLALVFPDNLLNAYQEIENKINVTLTRQGEEGLDSRARMGWHAFLFIIIHRSSQLNPEIKRERLREMIAPISQTWQDPNFRQSLSNMETFKSLLGLGQLPDFFAANNFHKVQDWSAQPLDAQGQGMQQEILDRFKQIPLRLTKSFLQASTEKLEEGSPAAEISNELWASCIPTILPNLLQLVSYAQSFNDIRNWSNLPEELQAVVKRMLTDRFWQAGISTESKDDFFNRVSNSKTTYEGLASTIRGTVRQIRELSYWILYGMIRFKDFFYGISDLPEPLSQALYGSADGLSAHHITTLLNMSLSLIDGCPAHLREHFLPPVISRLFDLLTRKLTAEWDEIVTRTSQTSEDDSLSEEMKTESILRGLTYAAVNFVAGLLDQNRLGMRTLFSTSLRNNAGLVTNANA